jgi:hypothetical protein
MHWTGILNLVAITLATAVVSYLWYFALPLWPVIYLGIPILIGLAQGVVIRRDQNRMLKTLHREPLDSP